MTLPSHSSDADTRQELLRALLAIRLPDERLFAVPPPHRKPTVTPPGEAQVLLRALLAIPPHETLLRRQSPPAAAEADIALLSLLLETTPAPASAPRLAALRAPASQRHAHKEAAPGHGSFDALLFNVARFLMASALLALAYWFVNVPIRDWIHEFTAPTARTARPVQATAHALNTAAPPPLQVGGAGRGDSGPTPRPSPTAQATRAPAATADATPVEHVARGEGAARLVAPSPSPTTALPLELPGHLLIPTIGVDTPVVEVFVVDYDWQVAEYAAGYLHGTALLGEPGNVVLSGHAGVLGSVFRDLGRLAGGEDIYVDTPSLRYHYRVRESKVVWPNQTEVLYSTAASTLTLFSCTNWDTQRLVVVADLVDVQPLIA